MLKITLAVFAVVLAGTASAAGWRSLRVDASSEAAFEQSLAQFKEKLSPGRRYAFGKALQDIWAAGTEAAEAEQRAYTTADHYR
jgi:outer membrane murein-binding lipoprotein Lpp